MRLGVMLFPTVGEAEKSAAEYYAEGLRLAELADDLGFHHLKIVEHYFFDFGGYSPDPVTFLAAAAARTQRIRMCTAAVVPAFTHPLKLAGKLAMLDNLAAGRLDVGFGRAFLPDEFAAFEVPIDESRERFNEGVQACIELWTQRPASWDGRFHRFGPVNMLPRPYQQPHPPVYAAVTRSAESVEAAARAGHHLQIIAAVSEPSHVTDLIGAYRRARADAGHDPAAGRVQLSYSCFVDDDGDRALAAARLAEQRYSEKIAEAVRSWGSVQSSAYPGYDKLADAALRQGATVDQRVAANRLLAGTPDDVREQIETLAGWFGEDVDLSLTVHTGQLPVAAAERTLRLVAEQVVPKLSFVDWPAPGAAHLP